MAWETPIGVRVLGKKHLSLGDTIQRIREAKKHLKQGNLDKAIDSTPCEGCKDKLRRIKDRKKGV